MSKKELTPKQQRFVEEYLIDLNATHAAIRAGYSEKTAQEQSSRLLSKVMVAEAIQQAMDKRSKRTEITQDYVLNTIRDTIERCKQAEPVVDSRGEPVMVKLPDGELAPAFKFNPQAVLKGAELLGKHKKMFSDKLEIEGESVTWNLNYGGKE